MDALQKHIRKAQRRMILQQFVRRLILCLSVTLSVAAVAVLVPKIWALGFDNATLTQTWSWAWIGTGLGTGILAAAVWTWVGRASTLAAAIEVDIRYGLKERVSSSLTLDEELRQTEWGQALMNDAIRQVERIDVTERFPVRSGWNGLIPILVTTTAVLIALLIPNAVIEPNTAQANTGQLDAEQTKVVKKTADQLRKEIEERKKLAEEKGLKEAEELFKKLEQGTKDLAKKEKVDQKETLLQLNDLAKELKKRRDILGMSEEFKKKLEQLANISGGPADDLAKAMKQGDLKKALDAMKELQNKLKNDELSKQEKEQLAKQMQEMGNKLQEMAKAHEEAKKNLQEQINQAKQAGDSKKAEELQKQLNQMGMQDEQMKRMQQMGDKLADAAQKMQNGQQQQAADQLDQMAQEMQDLQAQLDELEMLDEAMDQMEAARDQMCKACEGQNGQMMGRMGMNPGQMPGNGLGDGRGQGERPEEENETGSYDSQVRGDPKAGRGVIVDYVEGKNKAGQTLIDIKAEMESESSLSSDALTEVRLSKDHQQNAQEYFDMVREGR